MRNTVVNGLLNLIQLPITKVPGKRVAKILFLGENENGEKGGMHSVIDKLIPNEFISIKHLGMLEKGEESKFEKAFFENYQFEDSRQGTLLKIELDCEDEWADNMNNAWPKALQKLKQICEANC
ncbi:hypothetical protein [uncultured Christiangramia sp.]|uniref:hypothetical protein n=1 Tax=uncultured Christiangramia sp. TaxID=503836 RepID=UPI0025FAC15A|nr:hypothetical protein [uncultured Christiangramia sp.]